MKKIVSLILSSRIRINADTRIYHPYICFVDRYLYHSFNNNSSCGSNQIFDVRGERKNR